MSIVSIVKTSDRKYGVAASIKALGINPVKNKDVLIKPNFNTADPTPGSTHNDTLTALVDELWEMGASSISVGERSYPLTREVMSKKKILPLLKDRDVRIVDFDELAEKDWVAFTPQDSHWPNGFHIARPILDAECLVSTCCLKTHQFGGVFTMSLKLHVGVVPTFRHGFQYMGELHQSPHQQKMIAEINQPFSPDLVVMDGIDAFVDGGPATGKRAKGNLFVVSTDRIAVDAAGVAALKILGSNNAVMGRPIFQQEQIIRAVELGIGASTPDEITLLPADEKSREHCEQMTEILKRG
jgi:uncharacterized protein (DUF362 family)